MQTSKFLGHAIEYNGDEWVFSDTKESTVKTHGERSCGHCGKHKTQLGHDSCIANLDGVVNACCGHGDKELAYIQFNDGSRLDGAEVFDYLNIEDL